MAILIENSRDFDDNSEHNGNRSFIMALNHLQDRSANLAAGWLQGGWSYLELPEMMTLNLINVVEECAESANEHSAGLTDSELVEAWECIYKSVKKLKFASKASSASIAIVLLLIPLAIEHFINSILNTTNRTTDDIRSVSLQFIDLMNQKAAELGEIYIGDLYAITTSLDKASTEMNPQVDR